MQFIDNIATVSSDDSSTGSQHSLLTPSPSPRRIQLPDPQFRINAKRFLLTYPHYNETPNTVLELLHAIKPIDKAIACLELHQDGQPHVHAAIEFRSRVNSVNRRLFDLDGHHPNIQPARNWAACVNYCRKEGTIEVGVFGAVSPQDLIRVAPGDIGATPGTGDLFGICATSPGIRDWIQFCVNHRVSQAYAKWIWDVERGQRAPDFDQNTPLPEAVTDVRLRTLGWGDDDRILVICGPSGIGKTSWARAHIPVGPTQVGGPYKCLWATDVDDLKSFDERIHRSIIFDEIRPGGAIEDGRRKGKWPLEAQIKLLQWYTPATIRCRYHNGHLPAYIVKIFTCTNTLCFTRDPQIERRIRILNLYTDRSVDDLWEI